MTPSDKPERPTSPERDEEQASVSTKTVDDSAEKAPAEHDGAAEDGTASASDSGKDDASGSRSGELVDGTESPPPGQRASASKAADDDVQTERTVPAPPPPPAPSAASAGSSVGGSVDAETQAIPRSAVQGPSLGKPAADEPSAARTAVSFGGTTAGRSGPAAATSTARRPSRGPRRASLQVKRVDPWSVLKLALVLSVALFFVWMIAVAVLYGVLDGMGVWDQLNGTFTELTQADNAASEPLISAGRVFGVATIVGAINIVLITALATVAAFIYNVAADFAGGVEVTLSERE